MRRAGICFGPREQELARTASHPRIARGPAFACAGNGVGHRPTSIGFDAAEDRRRHTVTESGVVVVAAGEEPLIGAIDDNSLRLEAEADRRG